MCKIDRKFKRTDMNALRTVNYIIRLYLSSMHNYLPKL